MYKFMTFASTAGAESQRTALVEVVATLLRFDSAQRKRVGARQLALASPPPATRLAAATPPGGTVPAGGPPGPGIAHYGFGYYAGIALPPAQRAPLHPPPFGPADGLAPPPTPRAATVADGDGTDFVTVFSPGTAPNRRGIETSGEGNVTAAPQPRSLTFAGASGGSAGGGAQPGVTPCPPDTAAGSAPGPADASADARRRERKLAADAAAARAAASAAAGPAQVSVPPTLVAAESARRRAEAGAVTAPAGVGRPVRLSGIDNLEAM